MTSVGRNEPCPCGSGKKHKKCCLEQMQAATIVVRQQQYAEQRTAQERERRAAFEERIRRGVKALTPEQIDALVQMGMLTWGPDDGLDDLSNSALDLAREKRFDEALAACERLLREWPEVVDGFHRSAMVHELMGNHDTAVGFYRRAIEFAERPDQRDDFDESLRQHWRDKVAELS